MARSTSRGAPTEESARDVLAELAVAFLLLKERHVELAYEPLAAHGAGQGFAVRFRSSVSFYAEVTRMRVGQSGLAKPLSPLPKSRKENTERPHPPTPSPLGGEGVPKAGVRGAHVPAPT